MTDLELKYHTMEVICGDEGKAPHIFNLSSGLK